MQSSNYQFHPMNSYYDIINMNSHLKQDNLYYHRVSVFAPPVYFKKVLTESEMMQEKVHDLNKKKTNKSKKSKKTSKIKSKI